MSCARTTRRLRIGRVGIPLCSARNRVVCVIGLGVVLGTAPLASAAGIQVFTATLSGAEQVPPVLSPGTGLGTVILNATETQITVNLTFSGLTTPAILAHIHGPAAAGVNANILFDFASVVPQNVLGTIPVQTFPISPAQVAQLKAGLYYFNVHTNNFPNGEIRGQIHAAATQYVTTLTGAQQVPAVASGGTGTGIVALNAAENQLIVNMSFSSLGSPAILAHIHGPAPAGQNANILFDFASVVPNATAGSIPQQVFPISPAQVAELKAGLYYFNIHTVNFPNGEIRGQIFTALLSLDRTTLQFAAINSGAALTQKTPNQTVRILQSGVGTASWTATPSQPWITVTPTSGTGSATLTVGVTFNGSLPPAGTATGAITLALSGAGNSAGPITVRLRTLRIGTSAAPVGVFDTPAAGATGLTGSIAVTGWTLDDIAVSAVRVMRDPVPGEGSNLVFIGNAVLVDGARLDVAQAFPNSPMNTRAGWGYLLLTNFLRNGGNGTYRLHAIADDVDGHSTTLGTKMFTASNNTATKPFGAIDTPGQGETISGAAFANFGWVLARGPTLAFPPNGTVRVVIDGVLQPGAPTGWVSRADLTTLFPAATYPGVTNALGVYTLNTTALANGVHTIAWAVTANNGQADGIGSRFFTVANGAGFTLDPTSLAAPAPRASLAVEGPAAMMAVRTDGPPPSANQVNAVPLNWSPMLGRRGYDAEAPYRTFAMSGTGYATFQGEEMDRFELRLGGGGLTSTRDRYTGYLRVGDALAPLPIGSRLNSTTGVFTWQPGVGFLRSYDFVFVRWGNGQAISRQEVRIVINPKGSNRVGPQVVIDLPAAGRAVRQPFVVAGWAIDADSSFGTGVDTLHVWAYPVGNGKPIFLGATAYGGRRPDVGALFGERFRQSGYSLTVSALPPGTYDLAVFAWSTAAGGFVPARVVRVTVR